ncbi:response regulator [Magnetococcales bacterium HHB-1]
MSIRKKITLAFVSVALLVAILGGLVSYFSLNIEKEIDRIEKHTQVGIYSSSEIPYHLQSITSNILKLFLLLDEVIATYDQNGSIENRGDRQRLTRELHGIFSHLEQDKAHILSASKRWMHLLSEKAQDELSDRFNARGEKLVSFLGKILIKKEGIFSFDRDALLSVRRMESSFRKDVESQIGALHQFSDQSREAFEKVLAKELVRVRDDAYEQTLLSLLFSLGAFIIAFSIGAVLSRKISDPIERLQWAATEIGRGRYDTPIEIKSDDEIGRLAYFMEKMAVDLKTRITVLDQIIIEKNQVEEKLDEALTINQKILSSSNHGVVAYLADDGDCIFANPIAASLVGASSVEQILKQNFRDIRSWKKPGGLLEVAEEVLAIGGEQEVEVHMVTSFNKEVWLNAFLTTFQNQNKLHLLVVFHDISDRKQVEKTILQAKQASDEANQMKSAFLANMSHEIRTPMNAIIGLTDLALRQNMSGAIRSYLLKIAGSARSLLRIINDILDFSKIEAGKMELEHKAFLLREVFDHLSDMFSAQASKKHLELILCVSEECRYELIGDALRLEQVLMNLIGNAIKFTSEGEVEVQVKTRKETASSVFLEFAIRDTGIGMDAEQVKQLFGAFCQADSSTTRRFGGTGLGLSISKRLVDLMGGEVWVESKKGVGSLFHFTLPFDRKLGAEVEDMIPPEDLFRLNTLVVDDNRAANNALQRTLRMFGFNVHGVYSGSEALKSIEKGFGEDGRAYQLVLVDQRMPKMAGEDVVKGLRDLVPDSGLLKIILMTPFGYTANLALSEAWNGVDSYLSKPVNCSLLFDTIMESFGKNMVKAFRRGRDTLDLASVSDRIAGAKILLVEDHEVNQQVALEFLKQVGLVVDVAENGEEALAKVEKEPWDLILMDIQMPVMNGYDATIKIRQDERFQRLPIVAMTAHAMASDREKCLSVGMNDHLAKPIIRKDLYMKLIEWIGPRDGIGAHETIEASFESEDDLVKTPEYLPGIDVTDALERFAGNHRLFHSLLSMFYQDHAGTIAPFLKTLAHDTGNEAVRFAHTIRGTAGNISATRLFDAASRLETALSQQEPLSPHLLHEFEEAAEEVFLSIKMVCSLDGGEGASGHEEVSSVDRDEIATAAAKLFAEIEKSEFDALASFEKFKPLLVNPHEEIRQQLSLLEAQIEQIDFKAARRSLLAIAEALKIDLKEEG